MHVLQQSEQIPNKTQIEISKPFLSIEEKVHRDSEMLVGIKSTYMHVMQCLL
jgi:hypothetical protein